MSRPGARVATTLLLVMALVCGSSAVTCSDIYARLYPCLGYFQQGGGGSGSAGPGRKCCGAIRSFAATAMSGPNRRTTCGCLKSAAAGFGGKNLALARGLPGKCGVKLPYAISPSTDCTKVK